MSAWLYGDPHMYTLDGFEYTFNGLGEYTLLEMQNDTEWFKFQMRTAKVLTADGTEVDATVYSGFAVHDSSTDGHFQVEMNRDRTGICLKGIT